MRAFIGTILAIGLFVAVIWPGFLWGHPVWGPWGQTNVDMCVNFEGIQTSLPTGYIRSADGVCTPVTGGTTAPPPGGSTSNPGTAPVAPPVVVAPPAAPAPIGQCISRAELEKYVMIGEDQMENGRFSGAQGTLKAPMAKGSPWWVDAVNVGGVSRSADAGTFGTVWIIASARCSSNAVVVPQSAPATQANQPQAGAATGTNAQIAAEVTKYLTPNGNAVHNGQIGGYTGTVKQVPPAQLLQAVVVHKNGSPVSDPAQLRVGDAITLWLPDAGRPYPSFETLPKTSASLIRPDFRPARLVA